MIDDMFGELQDACLAIKNKEKFVLPNQLKNMDLSKIEYIVVGDNPGNEEYIQKKYFIGKKTNYIRELFKKIYGKDYEKFVLFLNKTPVSTNITNTLEGHTGIKETQEIVARLIQEILKKKKVPVWIMGHSHLKDFFSAFYERVKNSPEIRIFNHPSRNWFLRTDLKEALEKKNLTRAEFDGLKLSKHDSEKVLKRLQEIGLKRRGRL